ncbi:leucine-rich repeat and coiled-coil domain-containing protein 1-like [Watersipora subatra]|uniref:leucine-rich repeat and coiled-coil domain-containing protein 1-like n=1 Tax=Watersipora subatra TaxID=2589382 RepID=UPI00355C849A
MEDKRLTNEDNELFLVDSGVDSLSNVYLNLPNLRHLNLHSNYITRIENLTSLPSLTFLDLSSNQITRIEGLKYLPSLKHLNLSCNIITIVEGLTTLSSLVSLNLSYNQIGNLSGLRRLPVTNSLAIIQLQGNYLTDINHVIICTRGCQHLSCLVLHDGPSATNPLCSQRDYAVILRQQVTQLQATDKPPPDSENSWCQEGKGVSIGADSVTSVLSTPRIDAVLDSFHKALANHPSSPLPTSDSTSLDCESENFISTAQGSVDHQHDEEHKCLEMQLEQLRKELLKKKIEATELQLEDLKKASLKKISEPEKLSANETDFAHQGSGKPITHRRVNVNNNARPYKEKSSRNSASGSSNRSPKYTDAMCREAVSSTYQQLMKDLDMERMRRCKAEEAARHLAQKVKATETQSTDHQLVQRNCDDAITKLRKELIDCQENHRKKMELTENMETEYKELESELRRCRKTCRSQEQSIKKLEDVNARLEQLRLETDKKQRERREKDERELSNKIELLRAAQLSVASQKTELEDLKSLLAAREFEHKREMEQRYALDSPKLEQLFESKITSLVREQTAERNELEQRLDQCRNEYAELEDEFRVALQIEADRFQSLKTAFEDLSGNLSTQEQVLASCKDKDSRATKMIGDLTRLVKEQKERVVQLSKEKQEMSQNTQGAKARLEQEVQNLKNKLKDQERLLKDNIELKNQVQGQHSIISGLRKERELWSKELVEQGASLSNERGTLEAKIEALMQENKTLKANLEAQVDTVRIKSKLVSDLTDSVSTLKQRFGELERDCKDREKQLQCIKDDHEKEMGGERSRCSDLEHEVDTLVARKEELKSQLKATDEELVKVKDTYRSLKLKWQEKSSSVAALESSVQQMKEGWTNKEIKLTEERDKAIEAADKALQRLKAADDGFRKQLEVKELSYEERIQKVSRQYELRIANEQHKVCQVEEEMRELLNEKENSKTQFDGQLKKLSEALYELQNGVM